MPGQECPNCRKTLTRPDQIRLGSIVMLRQGVPCPNCGIRIRRTSRIYVVHTFALASIASGILHLIYRQPPTLLGLFFVVAAMVISSTLKIEIAPGEEAPIRRK
jgi:DNA-directed RNA polymerase subunit RPC12/RpoP